MKVLVINPFGIGDVIFSFALVEALRKDGYEIHYLCNERTDELVTRNPSIGKHFVFNRDRMRRFLRTNIFQFLNEARTLLATLKRERYDACFDLSLGREYAFFMMFLGIKKRIGFNYKNRGRFLTRSLKLDGFDEESVRDYHLKLLKVWKGDSRRKAEYPELRFDEDSVESFKHWCDKNSLKERESWIVIAPGGGITWGENAYYKQWAPDRYAKLARQLSRETGSAFIFVGDASERHLCSEVAQMAGLKESIVLAGQSLPLVMQVLKSASLFVGNDGGLLHLANLLRTPVVGLYGPVSEKVYGPLENASASVTLKEEVPCRPCYKAFQFPPCSYEKRCLNELSPEKVFEACKGVLNPA